MILNWLEIALVLVSPILVTGCLYNIETLEVCDPEPSCPLDEFGCRQTTCRNPEGPAPECDELPGRDLCPVDQAPEPLGTASFPNQGPGASGSYCASVTVENNGTATNLSIQLTIRGGSQFNGDSPNPWKVTLTTPSETRVRLCEVDTVCDFSGDTTFSFNNQATSPTLMTCPADMASYRALDLLPTGEERYGTWEVCISTSHASGIKLVSVSTFELMG